MGAAGVAGALVALKTGFGEAMDAAKVAAQTEAVLKSTGKSANVTAKHIGDLAGSLLRLSGVDDEVIQGGENLLLTFTNIRNEVGKGNDIFDQATKSALDMSVALGQDMKSSAIQLGKALNDPVKGLTSLQRVGVQFTAAQKEQIKALVASGDAMGAQKVILAELNKEFGGSAAAVGKTLPGQLNIARESFKNLTGELVQALLPAMSALIEIVTAATGIMSRHTTATKIVFAALAALTAGVLAVAAAMRVARAAQMIMTASQWLLNAALTANPIGVVIVAIAALTAGIILAYKHSATFRAIVTGALDAVKTAAIAVLNFFRDNWKLIAVLISGPFAPLVALATNAFGVRSALVGAFDALLAAARRMADAIASVFRGLGGKILSAVGDLSGLLYNIGASIIQGLINGLLAKLDVVRSIASSIGGIIKGLKGPIAKDRVLLFDEGAAIIEGLRAGMLSQFGSLQKLVGGFAPQIQSSVAMSTPTTAGRGLSGVAPAVGGGTVNITVNGWVGADQDIASRIRDELVRAGRRNTSIFSGPGVAV